MRVFLVLFAAVLYCVQGFMHLGTQRPRFALSAAEVRASLAGASESPLSGLTSTGSTRLTPQLTALSVLDLPCLPQSLGKTDLVDLIKDKTGMTKKDVETVIIAFTTAVRDEVLVGGKEIRLRDFGTFKQKKSAARVGRNPRTGEELQISGSTSVSFSVSQGLKVKDEAGGKAAAATPAPKKK